MRLFTLGPVFILGLFAFTISPNLAAQNCFNTGLNGTVINLPCNQTCVNIPVKIPHLKMTDDYTVVSVPYQPFPYITAAPALVYPNSCSAQFQDDKFFDTTFMPFSFCFYGAQYSKLAVSTNGLVSFDTLNALQGSNWDLTTPTAPQLPFAGGGTQGTAPCPTPSGLLIPRASIMGAYYDIDISGSSANKKMEVHVEGTAPCRKFVISYFEVPLFSCTSLTATQQIVLYESTGIVDVYIGQKPACSGWNGGRAIIGMQNWARDKAITAPGKNNTAFSESNTGYRFVPSGGGSRFVSCQVQTIAGVFLANGDTATTTAGLLDVTFPSFCPTTATGQYVVKTTFAACDNPTNQLVSYDTITINKTNNLNATAATTQTSCGITGTGTATVTVPTGIGAAPYTYVMTPGNISQPTGVFSALTAGVYSIQVNDAGGCETIIPVTITSTGVLSVNFTAVNTTCVGATNGSITVNPPNATPPVTYSINGGLFGANNVFSGLAAGTYFISVHDNGGCEANFIPITIDPGPSITMTYTTTPTSCQGANNGTVTITPSGTAPYQYAINGGTYQSSNTFTGLQANTYFIDVKDASGCTITFFPVTIPQGTGTVTGTAAGGPTSCAGVNNGSVTVTPTSGSGPYEYSINGGTTWQTSNVFNGLAPGNFNVIIREAGLCISNNIPATVTAGSGLLGTLTTTATTCPGVNNGTITVTPTSGTAPYTIVLDGVKTQTGTPTTTFLTVASGPHNIKITDANGCVTTSLLTTTVAAGTGYTTNFTATATSCAGVNNGSVLVTPQAPGTSPFSFVLSPGSVTQTGAANTTFINLAPGTYSAVVTDAAGCQSTVNNMVITRGAGLTGTVTSTPTTCPGVTNGSLTVTPTSGTAPYTIVLDGVRTQTGTPTTTFTAVGSGSHNITIVDANGCVTITALTGTVTAGTGYSTNFTSVATSCVGVNNGSLTVTPQTPGTSPYSFVLTPGSVTQTGAANTTFTNLAPGTYSAVVTDAAGCQSTVNSMVITQGSGLTGTLATTATTCVGATNGSVTVTPTSGTAPYTIVMDGTRTQTGAPTTTFTGTGAGSHSITITDANGCVTSAALTTTVAAGTGYTTNFTANGTSCLGVNNGSLTITPQTPATSPYTFVMTPGSVTQTGAANTVFTGLAPGIYSVAVTDAAGCQSSVSNMTITQGAGLLANSTVTPALCAGAANGSISITPTNGGGPYTFVMTPGNITQTGATATTFNNLAANTYNITVTDASGCNMATPIVKTITQPTSLTAPQPAALPVTCNGASNGAITVFPVGGTPPYTYSLDNISFQATNTFSVAQGTYTVYVKDANGCRLQFNNILITQPAQLNATVVSTTNSTCNGGSDGGIQINATGGTAPYQYSTNGGGNYQSTNTLNVTAGTYTVTVKDANNCTFVIPNIAVAMTDNLTLTTVNPPAICEGTGVQLQATSNAVGYSWTYPGSGASLSSTSIANPVASPTTTSTYTVTATLGNCTRTADITVTVMPAPIPDAGSKGDICFGQNFQLQASGGVSYTWSPATYLDNPNIANPQVIRPDHTMTYAVSVVDVNNCKSLVPDNVIVNVTPPIKISASTLDTVVRAGAQFQLQVASVGTDYVWSPATGLSNPYISNPVVTAPNVGETVIYKVISTTAAGCQGEKYITIRVYKGPEIFVVSAFTPNGDGKNDNFIPFPVGIKEMKFFRVFNRWGQLMYSTSTLNQGWDGKLGGVEQGSGVYIWMVQGITETGGIINKKGTVTLIR